MMEKQFYAYRRFAPAKKLKRKRVLVQTAHAPTPRRISKGAPKTTYTHSKDKRPREEEAQDSEQSETDEQSTEKEKEQLVALNQAPSPNL
jgi:hypothetical protein